MREKIQRTSPSAATRRQFLQATLAAGTALCGAPAFLRGRNLNDKLNIACIGVGGRGAELLDRIERDPQSRSHHVAGDLVVDVNAIESYVRLIRFAAIDLPAIGDSWLQ